MDSPAKPANSRPGSGLSKGVCLISVDRNSAERVIAVTRIAESEEGSEDGEASSET